MPIFMQEDAHQEFVERLVDIVRDAETFPIVGDTDKRLAIARLQKWKDADGTERSAYISPDSIKRFLPSRWLNDECIYVGMLLLHRKINPTVGFAMFWSTTISSLMNDPHDVGRFSRLGYTKYDVRDIWLMPIHRLDHWALIVVHVPGKTIYHFDSFADKNAWKDEVNVRIFLLFMFGNIHITHYQKIYPVICSLLHMKAKTFNYSGAEVAHLGWTSQRLLVSP